MFVESEVPSRSKLTSLKLSVSLIAGVPIVKTGFSATRNHKNNFYCTRLTDFFVSREVRDLTLNFATTIQVLTTEKVIRESAKESNLC